MPCPKCKATDPAFRFFRKFPAPGIAVAAPSFMRGKSKQDGPKLRACKHPFHGQQKKKR